MTDYLTKTEFATLNEQYRSGEVLITLPREVAKQFFLRITNAEVKQTTGRSIALKKMLIWMMTIASPLLFVASMISFGITHNAWEASFILPIAGICWIIIYSLTSAHGGWLVGTIPLALSLFLLIPSSESVFDVTHATDPVFLFVLSIWLQRTSFLLSDRWLMDITMTNFEAFEMMEEHLSFESD